MDLVLSLKSISCRKVLDRNMDTTSFWSQDKYVGVFHWPLWNLNEFPLVSTDPDLSRNISKFCGNRITKCSVYILHFTLHRFVICLLTPTDTIQLFKILLLPVYQPVSTWGWPKIIEEHCVQPWWIHYYQIVITHNIQLSYLFHGIQETQLTNKKPKLSYFIIPLAWVRLQQTLHSLSSALCPVLFLF